MHGLMQIHLHKNMHFCLLVYFFLAQIYKAYIHPKFKQLFFITGKNNIIYMHCFILIQIYRLWLSLNDFYILFNKGIDQWE